MGMYDKERIMNTDSNAPLSAFICTQCGERATYYEALPERCGRCGTGQRLLGVDQNLTINGTWLDVRNGCAVVLLKIDGTWQEAIRTPISRLIAMQQPHKLVIRHPDFPLKMHIGCSCGFSPPRDRDVEDVLIEHIAMYR